MIFWAYFSNKLTNPAFYFCAFGRKTLSQESFEKIFRNITQKIFKKIAKNGFLAYFSNKLPNYPLIFCALGRTTQIVRKFWENFEFVWWKFYRKIEFFIFYFYFFENLLVKIKIEPSEITPFFYHNFFRFRGGGFHPFPPGYTLVNIRFSPPKKNPSTNIKNTSHKWQSK